jgi:hypothetical protein
MLQQRERLQRAIQRRRQYISQQPRISVCTPQSQNPDLSHFCEMAGTQELTGAPDPLEGNRLQSTSEYHQFVLPIERLQDTYRPNQTRHRDLCEFQYTLASLNGRCTAYQHAYNQEVQRNDQLVQAYQLLVAHHKDAIDELAVMAGKNRTLQKEADGIYTEILAQDAVIREYERQRTIQSQWSLRHHVTNISTERLVTKIAELEREHLDMQTALSGAVEFIIASKSQHGIERAYGDGP